MYRFDDAYGLVYEYDEDEGIYFFIGTYGGFGITAKMSEAEKITVVEEDLEGI